MILLPCFEASPSVRSTGVSHLKLYNFITIYSTQSFLTVGRSLHCTAFHFLLCVSTKAPNCRVKRYRSPTVLELREEVTKQHRNGTCSGKWYDGSSWRGELKTRENSAVVTFFCIFAFLFSVFLCRYHSLVAESSRKSRLCQKHPDFSGWRAREGS